MILPLRWLAVSALASARLVTATSLAGHSDNLLRVLPQSSNLLQTPLSDDLGPTRRPVDLIHAADNDTFTAFFHPAFPGSSIRVKQLGDVCNSGSKAYTGYADLGNRHLFFYFFESRSKPEKDDMLMLISGGPGCSGAGSAFALMGPCIVKHPNATGADALEANPLSWNADKNYIFVDQPIGVGYSYSSAGEKVKGTPEASLDALKFTHLFFEVFSDFKGRPFHMAGGSYSGRSAPVFLADLYDFNNVAEAKGLSPVNIKSLSIGNGVTDYKEMMQSWYDKQCTSNAVEPVQTIEICVSMRQKLPYCMKRFTEDCIDRQDEIACPASWKFCVESLQDPIFASGISVYDLTRKCDTLNCYPQSGYVAEWAARNSTRKFLGVDAEAPAFTYCSMQVAEDFYGGFPDPVRPTTPYISSLLERGVRVLVFAGVNDWICNDLGNYKWAHALDWTGREAFNAAPLEPWIVNGKKAGETRAAQGLTWATVYGAGHMSSFDKPQETFAMMQRWLAAKPL